MEKQCNQCQQLKAITDYWNSKRSYDGKDRICIECRERNRAARESTPQGIYELQSRLLVTIFKPKWFPPYDDLWHIDHKFSIQQGFQNNVPLNVINNQGNLDLILKSDNLRKGSNCSITIDELYQQKIESEQLDYWANKIEGIKCRNQLRSYTILTTQRQKTAIC